MTTNKRKKVTKYRAHTTHGGGHRKKRRGAGSRGGRGKAGSGKRAGHKKFGIVLGNPGFRPRRNFSAEKTINVGYFTFEKVDRMVKQNKARKEGDFYVINLNELGYEKLLGTGKTTLKLKLTISKCSALAAEKVQEAGGEIMENITNLIKEDKKSADLENTSE